MKVLASGLLYLMLFSMVSLYMAVFWGKVPMN